MKKAPADIERRERGAEALKARERKLGPINGTVPALAWSPQPAGSLVPFGLPAQYSRTELTFVRSFNSPDEGHRVLLPFVEEGLELG